MSNEVRVIPLTQGYSAIVDAADYDRISKHSWYAAVHPNGRVCAQRGETDSSGKRVTILMHREIVGAAPGLDVDHGDLDALNNRRSNLRIATRTQNLANLRKYAKPRTSVFKGVSWNREKRKWCADITVSSQRHFLGGFRSEEDAARAYDAAASKYFGEFARLNFPQEVAA